MNKTVDQQKAELFISAALKEAAIQLPYFKAGIEQIRLVPAPGIGTVAIDKHWRLYYDVEFVRHCDAHEIVSAMRHEVHHPVLKHHERGQRLGIDRRTQTDWNAACDAVINYLERRAGRRLPEGKGIYPEHFKAPEGLTEEAYYKRIAEKREEDQPIQEPWNDEDGDESDDGDEDGDTLPGPDEDGDDEGDEESEDGDDESDESTEDEDGDEDGDSGAAGGDSDGESGQGDEGDEDGEGDASGPGSGGGWQNPFSDGEEGEETPQPSCGTGPQEWELPEDDPETPGLPEVIREQIDDQIAADIIEQSKQRGRGNVPGNLKAWADEHRDAKRPRPIDWRKLLRSKLAQTVNRRYGGEDLSYSRINHRMDGFSGGANLVHPGYVEAKVCPGIIIDTSGSVSDAELQRALQEVQNILSTVADGEQVLVLTADSKVQTSQRVSSANRVRVAGRGGTDMRKPIKAMVESRSPRVNLIIVITDGETPWPAARIPGKDVFVVLTPDASEYYHREIPKWMQVVKMSPNLPG